MTPSALPCSLRGDGVCGGGGGVLPHVDDARFGRLWHDKEEPAARRHIVWVLDGLLLLKLLQQLCLLWRCGQPPVVEMAMAAGKEALETCTGRLNGSKIGKHAVEGGGWGRTVHSAGHMAHSPAVGSRCTTKPCDFNLNSMQQCIVICLG